MQKRRHRTHRCISKHRATPPSRRNSRAAHQVHLRPSLRAATLGGERRLRAPALARKLQQTPYSVRSSFRRFDLRRIKHRPALHKKNIPKLPRRLHRLPDETRRTVKALLPSSTPPPHSDHRRPSSPPSPARQSILLKPGTQSASPCASLHRHRLGNATGPLPRIDRTSLPTAHNLKQQLHIRHRPRHRPNRPRGVANGPTHSPARCPMAGYPPRRRLQRADSRRNVPAPAPTLHCRSPAHPPTSPPQSPPLPRRSIRPARPLPHPTDSPSARYSRFVRLIRHQKLRAVRHPQKDGTLPPATAATISTASSLRHDRPSRNRLPSSANGAPATSKSKT